MINISPTIPDEIMTGIQHYLDSNPQHSFDDVVTRALALFLMQNGQPSNRVSHIYIDGLFQPGLDRN